jgi:hypothetical protein
MEFSAGASVLGLAEVVANAVAIYSAEADVSADGLVACLGEILGENWSVSPIGDEVWSDIAVESNLWTPVNEGTNTWLRRG